MFEILFVFLTKRLSSESVFKHPENQAQNP